MVAALRPHGCLGFEVATDERHLGAPDVVTKPEPCAFRRGQR
jgi:hypothetical protein